MLSYKWESHRHGDQMLLFPKRVACSTRYRCRRLLLYTVASTKLEQESRPPKYLQDCQPILIYEVLIS
jgi:hypothetical protein